jgi:hypothetical protein
MVSREVRDKTGEAKSREKQIEVDGWFGPAQRRLALRTSRLLLH